MRNSQSMGRGFSDVQTQLFTNHHLKVSSKDEAFFVCAKEIGLLIYV